MNQKTGKSANVFEIALQELEKIAQRMESGDQSLEQSLKDFERGIQLSRECQAQLQSAEQRVQQLIQQEKTYVKQPFQNESSE